MYCMYSFKEEFSRANNPFAFGKNGKKIRIMMNYACAAAILKMLKIKDFWNYIPNYFWLT